MTATTTAAGGLVRELRRNRGWTHSQMAAEVIRHPELGPRYAISAKTISNVEHGRVRQPYVRAAFAIATVLERQVSDLWPAS